MPKPIQHIAVMRLSAMGDVAMTVPVLRAFARQYPDVRLTVISRPFFRPFFDGIPNLDFFAFDDKQRHKGFLGLLRLYRDLQPLGIHAFADLHNVLRSKVVRLLFGLSSRNTAFVDKARAAKKQLTRPKNKVFKPLPTVFERHAEVFRQLGFPLDLSQPVFPPKAGLSPELHAVTGAKDTAWIGIAPYAQYDSKIYPSDLMQGVIRTLSGQNHRIFLFGGKNETAQLDALVQKLPNVVVVAGKISFTQELQLISQLDVMLSMDSGNAHLAAMSGIPVVTLWGATHPYAGFLPFNQPADSAMTADRNQFPKIPTSIYGNKMVEGYQDAMRTIAPEAVVARVQHFLT